MWNDLLAEFLISLAVMEWLGKIFYPKTSRELRRREMKSLLTAVIVALILSAILTVVIVQMGRIRHP